MRRMIRFTPVRLGVLVVVVFAMVLAAEASAATVTIGQTFSTTTECGDGYGIQTSPAAYMVPAGNWNVTSWSTDASAAGGSMSLMVFRPTTAGSYTVVGESPVESLTASSLNTFTLASPIAVQGGDLVGAFWAGGAGCGGSGAGVLVGDFGGPRTINTTVTPTQSNPAFVLDISATLTPALPSTKDNCKSGGWPDFGVFKNQGDCVSFVATGGKNQPALGN